MRRIKEFLQKKKGLGPVAALVLLAAVLGLAIALRVGKLENMFDPDSFVTQEEQKEEFDPREYGLEEDGRKQREEDTTREEETRQQESSREIPGDRPAPQARRQEADEEEEPAGQRIIYVDRETGEGTRRQIGEGQEPGNEETAREDDGQNAQPERPEDLLPAPEPQTGEDEPEREEPGDEDNAIQRPGDDDEDSGSEEEQPGGDNGEEPDDGTEGDWTFSGLTISYYRNQEAVFFYKEQVPSESYIRGNITVTGHWVNPEDPSQEKTEEESTFTLEAIPEEYAHRLTDADVNKSFTLTLTCRGQTASVRCVVRDDSIRYTGMQVRYDSTPVYVTGDILYEGESVNDAAIKEAVTVDVYGRTVQGGQDVYLPDEKNYQVAFQEETGGVAKKREDGSDWTADLIYYGPGEGTTAVFTEEDAVRYSVRDYRLTVMYDEETVLDTIYTDDKTVVLNAEYDGRCPYNEMVRALREDGRYLISEDGFLTDLFYGWSSVYPATAENREISYTFKNGQHTQVMYAIPLTPLLEEGYLVKMSGDDQVLCGYVPKKETGRLDVPYGITRVALDREFITSAPAESVTVLALSATVNSVDLSAAGQKFPKLAEYSVKAQETAGNTGEVNHIFCVKDGLLYSADGKMLWKVPAACQSFAVNKETETIAGGALADAARACDKTETLTVTMQAETPPELIKSEDTPVFGGADCQVQVKVPKTQDSVVEDLIYKRYLSAWGEIFDEELGETGAAAQCIQAAGGTEKTYENHGGDVYAVEGSERQLAFIDGGDSSIYEVPEEADGIEAYAFAEPGKVRFVRMGENVKRLAGNSLASAGGPSLQGVQIEGDTPMILGEYVAGETLSRELNLYISREQNEASGWIKRLTEDYGADAAARLLTLADGTLYVDGQGCVYISREDTEQALTLCGVPEDLNVYTAPEGCRVTEVAAGAFAWCSHLVYLELPDVTRVGEDAFLRCEDLEIVVLSSPELSEVENAFSGCDSLETVFMGKKGLSPVLPQQTELLEGENYLVSEQMIYEKKDDGSLCLRNVPTDKSGQLSLLDGTEEIGAEAFAGCARLTGVDAGQMQEIRRIGAGAFDGCHSLREAIIGEKCTSLGKEAFADCDALETVTWLGNTSRVGKSVFAGNRKLRAVYFGNDTGKTIGTAGAYTFADCTGLRNVYFEAGVQEIGDGCFKGCTNMRTSISGMYADACVRIGAYAFADCARYSQTLAMFGGLTEIGQGAFSGCTYLKSMWIPSQLREIPDECFAGCTSLRSVVVLAGAELETIGNKAFAGCTSLEELMNFALLPAMRKIGAGAFYDCTALRELPLHPEAKIVSLGEGAFKNCASLQNGDLEHTAITVLPVEAFAGCTSMETLLLPENLTAIKSRAVADCDSLREISIARRDDVVSVSADALSGTKENGHLSIYVPYTEGHGLRTAYRLSTDWWWALLDIPTWQSPVTIIKDRVMEEETFLEDGGLYQRNCDGTCRLLQVLSTDDGTFIVRKDTTEIAKDALAFCEDLSVLVLPEALTELPEGVLSHSRELEVLFVPAGLRLPSLSASLFGGEESSDSFALWVSADDQSYYEEAGGLPVRTYGRQGEVHGGVLYGTQEEEGESRILLQYVPRSFRGELHILLGTAEVADGAAKGCESLTAVSSTYTVERIGNEAFMGCTALKYMDFTNLSVTRLREIGDDAFADCETLSGNGAGEGLLLPASVERLGEGMLKNCSALESLSLQGWAKELPDAFCSGCKKLRGLSLTRSLLESVTRIGEEAFYGCEALPSASWSGMTNLTEVGDRAYAGCISLTQASFASALQTVGEEAFSKTALEMLSFNGANPPVFGERLLEEKQQEKVTVFVPAGEDGEIYLRYYDVLQEQYPLLADRLSAQEGEEYRTVDDILYLVDPEHPEQLHAIRVPTGAENATLYNASSLYCVSLEDGSFRDCKALTSLVIPNRVESIGDRVFENCASLKTLTIEGETLQSIGEGALRSCSSLKTLTLPESVRSLGDGMLADCDAFETLTVKGYTPFALGTCLFGETVDEQVRILVPMDAYEEYLALWGSQLDSEYGAGAGKRILMARSEDGTEKIENGVHFVWRDGRWQEKSGISDDTTDSRKTGDKPAETEAPEEKQPENANPGGENADNTAAGGENAANKTAEDKMDQTTPGEETPSDETPGDETSEDKSPENGETEDTAVNKGEPENKGAADKTAEGKMDQATPGDKTPGEEIPEEAEAGKAEQREHSPEGGALADQQQPGRMTEADRDNLEKKGQEEGQP